MASLYGSGTCGYRTTISWATIATFAGSVAAILPAQALLSKFSGKGLVPDELVGSPHFLLAVALGGSFSRWGWASPLPPHTACWGRCWARGLSRQVPAWNSLHFLSAGAVCFARGLNDTPKIVVRLVAASGLHVRMGLVAVAVAMSLGGLLGARRVAETMSRGITQMNAGQGLAANLSTAVLVTAASLHGMPVSTTHVSVGSPLGMGIVTKQAKWRPGLGILASWVVTLPCAALFSGSARWLSQALW